MKVQRVDDQGDAQVASKVYKPLIKFPNLSQTDVVSSGHSCKTAHNRNKEALVDFYTLESASTKYED